jgi:hypothetical protein
MHDQPQTSNPQHAPADHRSESDFLAAQAAAAKAALASTWTRMQDDLKSTADIPSWARKYPWPVIGIAAAVGFLGATALKSAKKPPQADVAAVLREALADIQRGAASHAAAPQPAAPARPTFLATLLTEVVRGLVSLLQGAVATSFFNQGDQPTPPPSSNGTAASNGTAPSNGAGPATDAPRDLG